MRHIASVSFGKDSLAMVLELMRREDPLDEAVFFNTGMEFDAIYRTRDRAVPIMEAHGVKYTELKMEPSFRYLMLEKPGLKKNGEHACGYGWCGWRFRWETKKKAIALGECEKQYGDTIGYIGIAADESHRARKKKGKCYPLVEWGLTEEDCLKLCYANGFFWEENRVRLYDIMPNVSRWCCRNKTISTLRNMYRYLPDVWQKLCRLQERCEAPYLGKRGSIFDLEKRFRLELEAERKQIRIEEVPLGGH